MACVVILGEFKRVCSVHYNIDLFAHYLLHISAAPHKVWGK